MRARATRLHPKIEVEPLSAVRWARVERAVFDAMAADERPVAEKVGVGVEPVRWRLAAIFLVFAGAVAAIAGGLAWRVVVPATRSASTRVETATDGSRVEFGESTIDVAPNSAVRLAGDDLHGVVVTLDHGRVECDVPPRRERPPFLVEAGGAEVRVVGTHFAVTRTGDAVSVEVQRGQVDVASSGDHILVPAGSRWPPLPQPPPASAPEEGSLSPPLRADGHSNGPTRSTPAESHSTARRSPPPAESSQRREQYEAASGLEATQPEAALDLYSRLASEGGAWGENALFAAGRLQADRGESGDARRLLREYLARYPGGPNAHDARQLLDRLR